MKSVTIFAIILTICGATMGYSIFKPTSDDYEKLADEITAKTAKKLKAEKDLILVGTGGRMMDDIKMMGMAFEYHKIVNIEEARKLLVYCIEEYLYAINSNKKIQPCLHNYPFTAKNIEIEIYIRNPDGSNVSLNEIKVAAATGGEMSYYVDYPEKHTIKAIHEETYEEALRILLKENP